MSTALKSRYVQDEQRKRGPYRHREEPRIVDHRDTCTSCGMSIPIFNEKAKTYVLCAWCTSKAFAKTGLQ